MPEATPGIGTAVGGDQGAKLPAPLAPPPALPGASAKRTTVAPPTISSLDMEPNDALFDAINRGDIGAARDAINRGADLHARNVLGMTPLELSVDLGRNDISFLLLSMRAGDDDGRSQAAAQNAAGEPPPVKATRQVASRRPAGPAARTRQPAPTQTARLFSGDGGTPIPNAGFLGFDPTRR
jgi:hypothetical protein